MDLNVSAQPSTCGGVKEPYSGALINSDPARHRGGFQYVYGVVEAQQFAIAADGAQIANWPAVWTDGQSWPTDGEDDVMEGLDGLVCATFHDRQDVNGHSICDTKITAGWHTFASNWEPGSVTYYYDGRVIGTVTRGVTSAPMYLVLDNTVHSGESTDTKPDSLRVKYVRVWQTSGAFGLAGPGPRHRHAQARGPGRLLRVRFRGRGLTAAAAAHEPERQQRHEVEHNPDRSLLARARAGQLEGLLRRWHRKLFRREDIMRLVGDRVRGQNQLLRAERRVRCGNDELLGGEHIHGLGLVLFAVWHASNLRSADRLCNPSGQMRDNLSVSH